METECHNHHHKTIPVDSFRSKFISAWSGFDSRQGIFLFAIASWLLWGPPSSCRESNRIRKQRERNYGSVTNRQL